MGVGGRALSFCEIMEFSEAKKSDAIKFLERFAELPPPKPGLHLPMRPVWPQLELEEVEGECLEMTKRYLSEMRCPGLLSYHMAAESCRRLKTRPLDHLRHPQATDNTAEATNSRDPDISVLTSSLVAWELVGIVHEVGADWLQEFPHLKAPVNKVELSMHGLKNRRRKMEDRYALCLDLNSLYMLEDLPAQSYYAVFDGHVGVEAAIYASMHMLPYIVRHPLFRDDLMAAIKEGIKKTDEAFCKKGLQSGSTVVAVFLRGDKLYTSWLGDSQALLVRRGVPLQLVNPHKPDREDEQKRIEAAGGIVIWMGTWRVNGNLSVSRAIGDAKLKKLVVGDADVEVYDMNGTEDYLVVACDGVWDVLNGEEVVKCVDNHLSCRGGSKHTVAQAIIDFAKSEGSGDNMTAIVVFFNGFTGNVPTVCPTEGTSYDSKTSRDMPTNNNDAAGDGERHSDSSAAPNTS